MSKRCELQKEYFKDFGNYKGDGKYSDDYVKWLEDKVKSLNQGQTLPLDGVSNSAQIDYSENDAEIAMPINSLMNEDGTHLTKKEYGKVLLRYLVKELREHYC